MPAELHLAEHTLPLQLLFERLQRLVDVVVTDDDLHAAQPPVAVVEKRKKPQQGARLRVARLAGPRTPPHPDADARLLARIGGAPEAPPAIGPGILTAEAESAAEHPQWPF
ncbi:hypothetical protein GCM10011504_25530 [Siccirubricoccus deserti]|nr:hypothetical protein GCM10011504_25530 [Siccirubricoccus deserti]